MLGFTHTRPTGEQQVPKPKLGMTLAFTPVSEPQLADVPARIIRIWPRFSSGDYLVTLEYACPVKLRNVYLQQIDAFVSELYQPRANKAAYLH
jgi:hypothetical protein